MLRRTRQPNTVKFLLSIDIGTTYTAASYCVFSGRDNAPTFYEINRWPKQEWSKVVGDAKVPSVLYYDRDKVPRLHGAETEDESSLMEAEQEHWEKAEWWKLRLRPEYLTFPPGFTVAPLPDGIAVDDVFKDQIAYVKENVRASVIKSFGNGEKIWHQLRSSMYVILTTPNGWEGRHQNRMRDAAVKAGLLSAGERSKIRFVSEGEAAIHYALGYSPSVRDGIRPGSVLLICDAGGGTTDIGIYKVRSTSPLYLEEVARPRCRIAGGVFVNEAAKKYIKHQLKGSARLDNEECIANALREFERTAKRMFKGSEFNSFVKVDSSGQSDESRNIQRGRLRIPRAKMMSFFDPLIKLVTQELHDALLSSGPLVVEKIILVGGFAESEYVYSELKTWANKKGLELAKPDGVLSKAISHGALTWHLESGVQLRVSKMHYGAETDLDYVVQDPEIRDRRKFQNILGQWRVRDGWNTIVSKNSRIRIGEEHAAWFHREFGQNDSFAVEMELYAYRWEEPPTFFKTKDGDLVDGFIHLGTVKANLIQCFEAAAYRIAPSGKKYKRLEYQICLSFDEIEISARLRWKTNKSYKYGEATIAYV